MLKILKWVSRPGICHPFFYFYFVAQILLGSPRGVLGELKELTDYPEHNDRTLSPSIYIHDISDTIGQACSWPWRSISSKQKLLDKDP